MTPSREETEAGVVLVTQRARPGSPRPECWKRLVGASAASVGRPESRQRWSVGARQTHRTGRDRGRRRRSARGQPECPWSYGRQLRLWRAKPGVVPPRRNAAIGALGVAVDPGPCHGPRWTQTEITVARRFSSKPDLEAWT